MAANSPSNSLIVVTGGGGFIGRHLVRSLVDEGARVRIVEKPGVSVPVPPGGEVVCADIRDRRAVRQALHGATQVYHLAANPQLWTHRRGQFLQVNYHGTVHVLEEALAAGAERVLHCSTESILTRSRQTTAIAEDQQVPLSDVVGPYCRSKYFAERHAQQLAARGQPIVIVNPTLPVGPGDTGLSPPTMMMLDCCRGKRSIYLGSRLEPDRCPRCGNRDAAGDAARSAGATILAGCGKLVGEAGL